MSRLVERQVHDVIVEHLGVDPKEVGPEVSLRDDLAADSLDLVEIVSALEERLGVLVPDRILERTRTCGDLVAAIDALLGEQPDQPQADEGQFPWVWASLESGSPPTSSRLVCADRLTPYMNEIIADAALCAGKGVELKLTFPAGATDAELLRAQEQFEWLRHRQVRLVVGREGDPRPRTFPATVRAHR